VLLFVANLFVSTKMSEQPTNIADDPFRGRRPTSHERMTGLSWDALYSDGPAPWDIGQPQPAIVRLASKDVFAGSVLHAGCGTGGNSETIRSRVLIHPQGKLYFR
jgi:hypothetical protein